MNVYKVCDLDLICMKLVVFREKDIVDLQNLILDCPAITQDMLSNNLVYLYGDDVFLQLKSKAITFVRTNVRN